MMVAPASSTSGQLSVEQLTLVPGSAVYSASQYVAAAYWTQKVNWDSSLVETVSAGWTSGMYAKTRKGWTIDIPRG